jgi:hypothetical protein
MADNIAKNIGKNGAVLNVGNPGNAGGTGRPKSEIRARCAGSFDQRIAIAEEIADNPDSSQSDRLRALDLLAKYGGLQQTDVTSGDKPVDTLKVVFEDEPKLGV